jgi:hypothetical protein
MTVEDVLEQPVKQSAPTGRKPDLTTDRFVMVGGAIIAPLRYYQRLEQEHPENYAVIRRNSRVRQGDKIGLSSSQLTIRHEILCGTVDELVANFRQQLLEAAGIYFGLEQENPANTYADNEAFQKHLQDHGINGLTKKSDCNSDAIIDRYIGVTVDPTTLPDMLDPATPR